jgi:preprotein translocase subunit SecD
MRNCLSACLGLALAAACATDRRVLTVHLADYADKASSNRVRIEMPRGEAPLYAEPTPVLDERDFRSVSFGDTTDEPTITLCFTSAGRDKFTRVVEHNIKRRLVFLVRGRLLLAPVIDSATVRECTTIQGYVSPSDADALRRAIQ